jgi:GT2 family glycosyltransferase
MSTSTSHKVVAVVLHFNSPETLLLVVEGIKNQTFRPAAIVVVDNASGMDLSGHFERDPDVTFVRLESNVGVGAGHNYGWKLAMDEFGGELIWSLEHDAIPKPDCLSKLLQYYNPESLAAIGPVEDAGLEYDVKDYYVFHSSGLRKLHDKKKKEVYRGGMSFNGVLIPVHLLRKVGFLNELFFVGREDFDFFRRIYQCQGYVLRIPSAQVLHNLYKENKQVGVLNKVILFPRQSILRQYYSYRNSVYMSRQRGESLGRLYLKHYFGLLLILLFRGSKLTRLKNRVKAFKNGLHGVLGK